MSRGRCSVATMLRPAIVALPALLLLLDPHDCGARRRNARTTSEATTTETPVAAPVAPPPPPDTRDAGGTIALTLSVPPTPREETPERHAFYEAVSVRWMQRLRRDPEGRREADAYIHRDPSEPWSPPPWPVGLSTAPDSDREARFPAPGGWGVGAGDEYLRGVAWHRHGLDRACCYNTSPTRPERHCFDVTGRTPRYLGAEPVTR